MEKWGGRPGSTVGGRKRARSKLHRIYYYLAAFDLITAVISFALVAFLVNEFNGALITNKNSARLLGQITDLRRDAGRINEPGNELFREEKDPRIFEEGISRASNEFDANLAAFKRELFRVLPTHDIPSETLEKMAVAKQRMQEAALDISRVIASNRPDAGERMAEMDKQYSEVLNALDTIGRSIRDAQRDEFNKQAEKIRPLQIAELAVGGLIFVMVVLAVVYGHRMTRRVKELTEETERRLSDLVEQRTRELDAKNQQLRMSERLASIGTLAAGLGHDMNNVLFPVRCRIDTLNAASFDANAGQELESIRQSLDYLQQLADGLRLLALDPEDQGASGATTDIVAWSSEVNQLFSTALPAGALLVMDIPPSTPRVTVAPHRLTQAMFNLVVNAGESIGPGGRVVVRADHDPGGGTVRLSVTDNGSGMSADVLRQASDPFFTTKTRGMSTGLGLASVHGVAQGAGGQVTIKSEPGSGTCVTLTLDATHAVSSEDVPPARAAVGLSVDDPEGASIIAAMIRAEKCTVVEIAGDPADTRLWFTTPSDDRLDAAREFVASGGCLVVVGAGDDAWSALHSIGLEMPPGPAATRQAIREGLSFYSESTT